MSESYRSTADAVSADSGLPWAHEGAWAVEDHVYRIPLPLPNDGLRAVNVYALETEQGLTLIDGGWAIEESRRTLEQSLRSIGYGFGDIRQFLVTHMHRDHYSLASLLGKELGARTALGRGEEPAIALLNDDPGALRAAAVDYLTAGGAPELAFPDRERRAGELDEWRMPDQWLDGVQSFEVGARTLEAIPTPGHTPGHYVFADTGGGALFAGDHVLPTITPSIGLAFPRPDHPLGNYLASLARVRALPDLRLLPAHGPIAPSTHARVDELLEFHEERLALSLDALGAEGRTAAQVAGDLPWTRRGLAYVTLDLFNAQLAVIETMAHLDVLVARGAAHCVVQEGTNLYSAVALG